MFKQRTRPGSRSAFRKKDAATPEPTADTIPDEAVQAERKRWSGF